MFTLGQISIFLARNDKKISFISMMIKRCIWNNKFITCLLRVLNSAGNIIILDEKKYTTDGSLLLNGTSYPTQTKKNPLFEIHKSLEMLIRLQVFPNEYRKRTVAQIVVLQLFLHPELFNLLGV